MTKVENQTVSIATQTFGQPTNPAVVLIMGATASMLGWPDELCHALSERQLFVVRFDHRDTGRSTTVPPGEAAYSVEDMVSDVVSVLDAHGLTSAHIVGMSLGGYIAQILANTHPDRVLSLTLIGSEPLGWNGPALPHISQAFLDHFGQLGTLDWSDTHAVAAFLLETDRLCAGSDQTFDEGRARTRIAQVLARTESPASMFNHGMVTTNQDWTNAFRKISCPVLVIHGENDPILPVENGQAIASGIAGTTLHILSGVGHALPLPHIPATVELVALHVGRRI